MLSSSDAVIIASATTYKKFLPCRGQAMAFMIDTFTNNQFDLVGPLSKLGHIGRLPQLFEFRSQLRVFIA